MAFFVRSTYRTRLGPYACVCPHAHARTRRPAARWPPNPISSRALAGSSEERGRDSSRWRGTKGKEGHGTTAAVHAIHVQPLRGGEPVYDQQDRLRGRNRRLHVPAVRSEAPHRGQPQEGKRLGQPCCVVFLRSKQYCLPPSNSVSQITPTREHYCQRQICCDGSKHAHRNFR